MKNNLYEELYDLEKREEDLKRNLDIKYMDKSRRKYYFEAIKETQKDIKRIRFKIKVKKEMEK